MYHLHPMKWKNWKERLDEVFEDICEDTINNIIEAQTKKQKKRAYIERNREAGHIRLWNDYFSENPHMRNISSYAVSTRCYERLGLSPLQKCTAAIRMLSYGSAADAVDEYLRLGESTALSCLHHFTYGIVQLFGEQYLRRPTPEDLQRLLDIGEKRGFPGMIGSIDCMQWEWKNCPTTWKGQYARGSNKPTIVLEAVASQDLWIWHAFFGPPCTLDDINVLDRFLFLMTL
ncbi:uncharacterized protein LOC130509887 [Raphanus sativus]|uniref:Uncharacterized protein LOC130509887 n=1 Tax=Raphanus sativus TaxID=3726 RepID=A0A9W3DFF5_RAPSA|nr:uncharacterized protein LOC130509887 [Raphanus sativus]